MASTTLTSKGQMTLPKAIRAQFNLRPGDRIDVSADGDRIVLVPSTLQLAQLCAILPRPKRVVSLQEIDATIRRRGAARSR